MAEDNTAYLETGIQVVDPQNQKSVYALSSYIATESINIDTKHYIINNKQSIKNTFVIDGIVAYRNIDTVIHCLVKNGAIQFVCTEPVKDFIDNLVNNKQELKGFGLVTLANFLLSCGLKRIQVDNVVLNKSDINYN